MVNWSNHSLSQNTLKWISTKSQNRTDEHARNPKQVYSIFIRVHIWFFQFSWGLLADVSGRYHGGLYCVFGFEE
jgi:hypothetical protein